MNPISIAAEGEKSKRTVYDPLDVVIKYSVEKPTGFAKAIYTLGVDVPWLLGFIHDDNVMGKAVKHHLSLYKLACSPGVLLSKGKTAVGSLHSYLTQTPVSNGGKAKATVKPLSNVIRDAAGVVGPVNEIATFFSRAILFIPKASLQGLKGVNGVAGILTFGWLVAENLWTLSKNQVNQLKDRAEIFRREEENMKALMNLIRNVSYLSLGVLNTLCVFGAVTIEPVVFTALAVTGVVFTILPFYVKHIGTEKTIT